MDHVSISATYLMIANYFIGLATGWLLQIELFRSNDLRNEATFRPDSCHLRTNYLPDRGKANKIV